MRGIRGRFVMLIATAAVAPLVTYGLVSIVQMREGTRATVLQGNSRVASQAAEQIRQYISNNERVLRSIGLELQMAGIERWQQSRLLRDYLLEFPEFREISAFGSDGRVIATSRFGDPGAAPPAPDAPMYGEVSVAPLTLDEDELPTTTIAVRLGGEAGGWIVGEIALEELWRMVDRIRIGEYGFAALLSQSGRLIAHGNPDKKRLIASANPDSPLEQEVADPEQIREGSFTYNDERGQRLLAVVDTVPDLGWTVVVEQATSEAYALWNRLQAVLIVVICAALLGTMFVGWLWGRSFITRIFALRRATQAISEGRLDERVTLSGDDEIHELGDAFNSMADSIVQLQEDVRKQERQAMFGRVAAGLVHDLSTPVMTVGNNFKLLMRQPDNVEERERSRRLIERELDTIRHVLEDMRNIARPIPLERFPINVDRSLADVIESMQPQAELAGLTLKGELESDGAYIEGDLFALGRVYRNLIINAIQATPPKGLVVVATEATQERVQIRVYDTGCGIPADRVGVVFEDFVTTKRRGLGLGLAISKKIVEQLGGQISVASEVNKGTTFVLDFPRTRAQPVAMIAG
jgi:signal transduction histidine kinase